MSFARAAAVLVLIAGCGAGEKPPEAKAPATTARTAAAPSPKQQAAVPEAEAEAPAPPPETSTDTAAAAPAEPWQDCGRIRSPVDRRSQRVEALTFDCRAARRVAVRYLRNGSLPQGWGPADCAASRAACEQGGWGFRLVNG
ncbi:MAG TPA: hypothetical protein VF066_01875 [Thermoleophilaceae bacterium]